MTKTPFVSKEVLETITEQFPTPFHLYDEKAFVRRPVPSMRFSWNKGFKEYFAVKATPTPAILKILQEEGCGVDCATDVEVLMSENWALRTSCSHPMIPRRKNLSMPEKLGRPLTLMPMSILSFEKRCWYPRNGLPPLQSRWGLLAGNGYYGPSRRV